METKSGFIKMNPTEFSTWITGIRIGRTITKVQHHHTYIPDYSHFTGNNHFERQQAMKNHHISHNGWMDIGQHFTIFPDGSIMTGRSIEKPPACITGQNANAICIESFGNFDLGADEMRPEQKRAIVIVTSDLCKKLSLAVNTDTIVYHHWFDLNNGSRNNGTRNNKSCPGTGYFGGNKVADCASNLLPLVTSITEAAANNTPYIFQYVSVNTAVLNVRTQPSAMSLKSIDLPQVYYGSILRVYDNKNSWYKISNSRSHWVSGRYTLKVNKAIVTADILKIRSGPGVTFSKAGTLHHGEIIFISTIIDGWGQIALDDKWVKISYIKFE